MRYYCQDVNIISDASLIKTWWESSLYNIILYNIIFNMLKFTKLRDYGPLTWFWSKRELLCTRIILKHPFPFSFKCGKSFMGPGFKASWHPEKRFIIVLSQHIITLSTTYQFMLLTVSPHLEVQHSAWVN